MVAIMLGRCEPPQPVALLQDNFSLLQHEKVLERWTPDFRPFGSLGLKFSLIFNEKILDEFCSALKYIYH